MCPKSVRKEIKAYYVADDIFEIDLPEELSDLPELGDIEELGIIGYILIANREELTIITNKEEYLVWKYFY